jgi:hypothetical protein
MSEGHAKLRSSQCPLGVLAHEWLSLFSLRVFLRALRLKAAWDKMTALAAPLAAAAEAAGQTFEVAVDDTIHFEEPEEEPTEQEAKDKLAAFTDAGEQGGHVAGEEDGLDAQGRSCSRRCEVLNTGTACDKKAVGAYVICPLLPIRIFGTGSLYNLSAASCTHLRHLHLFVPLIETHLLGAHMLAPLLFRPTSSSRRMDNFYWSCLCLLFTTDFIPHVHLAQIASCSLPLCPHPQWTSSTCKCTTSAPCSRASTAPSACRAPSVS